MKTVIIGSHNPVKEAVTKKAFELVFPTESFTYITCKAESGVPAQPFGIEETREGACNRSNHCKELHPEGDYFVGLEGGLEILTDEHWVSGWMYIQDTTGRIGYGRTGAF